MVSRMCEECGKEFMTHRAWLRKGLVGKYCSRSCASKNHPSQSKRVVVVCVECKGPFTVKRYRIGTAKCCSIKCRQTYTGKSVAGSLHPKWRGGSSKGRPHAAKIWAKKVKGRDKNTCTSCGATGHLEAHHIKEWSGNEALRYDIRNGETLCITCHELKHPELAFIGKHYAK